MTSSLALPSNAPLVVTPGTVANLALDFNLAASNAIAPSATNPTTVTVDPVLTGSLVPDQTKQIRVRGSLVSTDATAGTYTVDVHPFDDDGGDSGQFTVAITASTSFTIDGTNTTGAAGLAQLATLTDAQISIAPSMLAATDEFAMNDAFQEISAVSLSAGLNFVPDPTAVNPNFVIVHQVSDKADSYATFNDFVTALATDLNGSTDAVGVAAAGPYDASTSTVSVGQMIVMLND